MSVAPSENEPPRLDALTGLRLLAIAHVVCYHAGDATFEGSAPLLRTFRERAETNMPLFFLLSGFLLTYVYAEGFVSGRLRSRAFLLSRLFRIWPIYLVALVLADVPRAVVHHGLPAIYVAAAVSQGLMVQTLTPPLVWFGNAPGWTVSVEMFLYLLFPWLVVRMSRLRLRRAAVVVGTLWIVGLLFPLAFVLAVPDHASWSTGTPSLYFDLVRYLPPLHLPSFLLGMLTARVFMEDLREGRKRASGLIALAGFLPVLFTLGGGLDFLGRHGVSVLSDPFPFTHNGLLAPAWALLVFGLAHGSKPARWLATRPLVRLGEASYGLYILHAPVLRFVRVLVFPDWERTPWFLLQFFAVMLPLSVLSFERLERPLRTGLLRRWRIPRPTWPSESVRGSGPPNR